MTPNKLWTTSVGSQVWGMSHPNSDNDLFTVVLAKTEDLHRGLADLGSRFVSGDGSGPEKTDEHVFELQKHLELTLTGNFNMLVAAFSPIVICDAGDLGTWRQLVRNSLSKNLYHSTNGLAVHNRRLAEKEEGYARTKKLRTICRSLKFGIALLEGRGPVFEPVFEAGFDTVDTLLAHLNAARDASTLPETTPPSAEAAMRSFMASLRVADLKGYL